uniref:Uncharacterized protein n=1 Tax=Lotharella globosa TaxID=91324 RepID=A0A7S4DRL3_9EUKA
MMVAVGGLSMKEAVMSGIVGEGRLRPYEVLCVFFSLVYISSVLDLTGGLEYIALLAASRAKSGRSLFLLVGTHTPSDEKKSSLASVLTLVTSNDVVILLLTPDYAARSVLILSLIFSQLLPWRFSSGIQPTSS